jgi:DNA-binding FrmR family transcriptional regulator
MKRGTDQQDKLVSLRRIEGQIRGIQKMIGERRYCIDILRAIGAAAGALKSVEAEILKAHLNACVKTAVEGSSRKEKEAKLNEIYEFFKGFRK